MNIFNTIKNLLKGKQRNSQIKQHCVKNGGQHIVPVTKLNKNALKVIKRLQNHDYQAFLVGGGVRDLLIGKAPKDFDIATSATPQQVRQLFRNCRLIGRRFRLAHVYFFKEIIEVSTFRSTLPATNPDHTDEAGMILRDNSFGSLDQDVWRRDFTINALYYDPKQDHIVDYVNGLTDIKQKVIRIIGDAKQRYREDPVRMLRAIRFAAKLNFTIEADTQAPFAELKNLLHNVSSARLYEELQKLFFSGHAEQSYQQLQQFGFLDFLFPILTPYHNDQNVEHHIKIALQSTDQRIKTNKSINPAFLLAVMLWQPFIAEYQQQKSEQPRIAIARQAAMQIILTKQNQTIAIPKRVQYTIKDIWELQFRLPRRLGKRAFLLLNNKRFRAGFDFLELRAKVEPDLYELVNWWNTFQTAEPEVREEMVNLLQSAKQPRKKRVNKKKAG